MDNSRGIGLLDMWPLNEALIADGSKVCLQLFSLQLKHLVPSIRTASSVEGALAALRSGPAVDLLLVDMHLPGGGAPELLRRLEAIEAPRPSVIILGREGVGDESRVPLAGVAGYLSKPLKPGSLATQFWKLRQPERSCSAAPRVDYLSPIVATVLDEAGGRILECEVRNLSRSGALLHTQGPLEVGCELRLQLHRQQRVCELSAVVVRVQEPQWSTCPGVAISFSGADPGCELAELLEPEL